MQLYKSQQVFIVDAGFLYCDACRHTVVPEKTTVRRHLQSAKHMTGVQKRQKRLAEGKQLGKTVSAYLAKNHVGQSMLPGHHQAYRATVTETFLESGIPLSKLSGSLREILEDGHFSLTTPSHMAEYIPALLEAEMNKIATETKGHQLSVIFDSTCNVDEVFAVVIRYSCSVSG